MTEYLIRFDDICPTMNWSVWKQIETAMASRGIRPVLAVVPDNRDPDLMAERPHEDFWGEVRRWQSWGWTIAMHGYQHRYVSENRGILRRTNRRSEFAGLPPDRQREKLHRAVAIFRREGLRPEAWVAPSHSFDQTTVEILREIGITTISDGFWRAPYRDSGGILWVPQQLWRLRWVPPGVWTVCYHLNRWGPRQIDRFRRDLDLYGKQISPLDDVVRRFGNRSIGTSDRLVSSALNLYVRAAGLAERMHAGALNPDR